MEENYLIDGKFIGAYTVLLLKEDDMYTVIDNQNECHTYEKLETARKRFAAMCSRLENKQGGQK